MLCLPVDSFSNVTITKWELEVIIIIMTTFQIRYVNNMSIPLVMYPYLYKQPTRVIKPIQACHYIPWRLHGELYKKILWFLVVYLAAFMVRLRRH